MIYLTALALVAFALTLIGFGVFEYVHSRQRRALIPPGIGALLILLLFFLASRLARQLFGRLPLALDLRRFALQDLFPLLVIVIAAAVALGILFLLRQRRPLALALMGAGAGALMGALVWMSQTNARVEDTTADDSAHPTLADIQVPEGFRVQTFAARLDDPTALAFDNAGNLYYSELVDGDIVRLRDANTDGVADENRVFASGFKNPRGLAWHNGDLYVSSRGQINVLRDINTDGVADQNQVIVHSLFSIDIQHSNNGIAFGPDAKLFIAIGGPRVGQLELRGQTYWYDGQPRDAWQFGGVLQADADGKNLKMFARGLRNPYSVAFGADGQLYASDNGDETIPVPDGDELNLIQAGADYGYPYFFGIPPAWSNTREPLVRFPPHSAPTGITVYNPPANAARAFPKNYVGNILTALYWHGSPDLPYREVVRVVPENPGGATDWTTRDFVEGLDRPTALAIGPDGALYIADMRGGKADPDAPGSIYRVSYVGK